MSQLVYSAEYIIINVLNELSEINLHLAETSKY